MTIITLKGGSNSRSWSKVDPLLSSTLRWKHLMVLMRELEEQGRSESVWPEEERG